MNNLLKIVVLLFASTLLLSSCKNMSVTKRHYNKGYYVSHSHRQKAPGKVERLPEQPAITKQEERTEFLPPKNNELKTSQTEEKEIIAYSAEAPKYHRKLFARNPVTFQNDEIEMKDVVKNPMKMRHGISSKATGEDALSLIWILIVVLLIVYLIGILLDGFGLGSLIHILGVVIIVLLILWLLRLI